MHYTPLPTARYLSRQMPVLLSITSLCLWALAIFFDTRQTTHVRCLVRSCKSSSTSLTRLGTLHRSSVFLLRISSISSSRVVVHVRLPTRLWIRVLSPSSRSCVVRLRWRMCSASRSLSSYVYHATTRTRPITRLSRSRRILSRQSTISTTLPTTPLPTLSASCRGMARATSAAPRFVSSTPSRRGRWPRRTQSSMSIVRRASSAMARV